ncbi:hypothetical protein AMATHDRAFT_48281 [Amanita thiersii Skay4041]|uniref:Uncharacterized protein n=1 Tax=Amanita thiersii Skay4041 TaxID=703135 RepID=A0A2A9NQE7_9AGAR|nr:hypothetical protein AMATHDRAFT_48281 [Amanita thiersii Skay4041]
MKVTVFTSIIAFAFFGIATASKAGPVAVREALPEPVGEDVPTFFKRACTPSKCLCNKVQGEFCGNQAINSNCLDSHVYECNSSTGKTCDFGVRSSCTKCGRLSC